MRNLVGIFVKRERDWKIGRQAGLITCEEYELEIDLELDLQLAVGCWCSIYS